MPLVVSDTSPIRALAYLHQLDLLEQLFESVLIPPAVARELENPPAGLVRVEPATLSYVKVVAPHDLTRVATFRNELDQGEAEALALALETRIETVLLDEAAGRAAAVRLGLTPVGVLGLLIRGKKRGHVVAIRPLIEKLIDETRFFLSSELVSEALRYVGE